MKEIIHIVLISDDNYAVPTAVVITSLKENRHPGYVYYIHVLSVGISDHNIEKLLTLDSGDFHVNVIQQELSPEVLSMKTVRGRVTPAAMLKFDLPSIFPDLSKILYLDSDILIQKNLVDLFHTNLQGYYAAVVKDTMTYKGADAHLKWLQFEPEAYFNSGVMLLNLEKMRQDNLAFRLKDYRRYGLNSFTDQDALNVVFGNHVRYMSPYYNLLTCFFEWETIEKLSEFYSIHFAKNTKAIFRKAAILHFGDRKKPWKYEMGYLSDLYRHYYDLSPYAKEPLVLDEWKEQITNYTVPDSPVSDTTVHSESAPQVSVLIPCMDKPSSIQYYLENVILQNLKNIEIICLYNGHDSSIMELLQEYAQADLRICVVCTDSTSYGHLINQGILSAKGKYVAIMRPGCSLLPEMYEDMAAIAEREHADFIESDYYEILNFEDSGRAIRRYRKNLRTANIPYNQVIDSNEKTECFQTSILHCIGLYSLDFLKQNDILMNENSSAIPLDNSLWFQVRCKSHRAYFVDTAYCCLDAECKVSSWSPKDRQDALIQEYNYIQGVLRNSPALEKRFSALCSSQFKEELKREENNTAPDSALPQKQDIYSLYETITKECDEYSIQLTAAREELRRAKDECAYRKKLYDDMASSFSFRLGRRLTYPARYLRNLLRR